MDGYSNRELIDTISCASRETPEPCPYHVPESITLTPTRGERNRNPGNIERDGSPWQGLASDRSLDDKFCVFTDVLYGVRALANVLLTYQRVYGLKTLREIINRWAASKHSHTDTSASVFA